MIQKDLAAARKAWIKEASGTSAEKKRRETSSFLAETDARGRVVDFHALRMTFITNLTLSGVAPKTAQLLARHCDINLTMNTYTTLGVLDQAAAVEALPPIPDGDRADEQRLRATGTDGHAPRDEPSNGECEVPTMVPSGAENGAKRLASEALRIAPHCTDEYAKQSERGGPPNAENPEENGAFRASSQRSASTCTSGRGGIRTRTPLTGNRILSPVRLPVPPLGLPAGCCAPCAARCLARQFATPQLGSAASCGANSRLPRELSHLSAARAIGRRQPPCEDQKRVQTAHRVSGPTGCPRLRRDERNGQATRISHRAGQRAAGKAMMAVSRLLFISPQRRK
jgi:hypothetical protein